MNRPRLSIVLGSLLGAAVLHVVIAACSGTGASTPDAHARDATAGDARLTEHPACASWQIAAYYAPSIIARPTTGDWPAGLTTTASLPAGWEPLTASPFGGSSESGIGVLAVVRRCAP